MMAESTTVPWVEPTQARSREKVERLLDAALALAVERDGDDRIERGVFWNG